MKAFHIISLYYVSQQFFSLEFTAQIHLSIHKNINLLSIHILITNFYLFVYIFTLQKERWGIKSPYFHFKLMMNKQTVETHIFYYRIQSLAVPICRCFFGKITMENPVYVQNFFKKSWRFQNKQKFRNIFSQIINSYIQNYNMLLNSNVKLRFDGTNNHSFSITNTRLHFYAFIFDAVLQKYAEGIIHCIRVG